MKKSIIVVVESLDVASKLQQVLSGMETEAVMCAASQLKQALYMRTDCNLVIFEITDSTVEAYGHIESDMTVSSEAALLTITPVDMLGVFRLPIQIKSDFAVKDASAEEMATRIRTLLWPGNEVSSQDIIVSGALTINLATYQVKVADTPLDFTYLEYALLSFLVTHPGRAYPREALLQRIWGYEYFGGTRTVDVHVRRVRAKLGLELAQHLETVRGVGYMWNSN